MRGIERLTHDPYAAALVAQHRLHVYRQYADASEWRPFFNIVREVRDTQLRAARLGSFDQLLRDYAFVRAGGLASLAFCNIGQLPQIPMAAATPCVSMETSCASSLIRSVGGPSQSPSTRAKSLPNGSPPPRRRGGSSSQLQWSHWTDMSSARQLPTDDSPIFS
jgi:hypothetical protein